MSVSLLNQEIQRHNPQLETNLYERDFLNCRLISLNYILSDVERQIEEFKRHLGYVQLKTEIRCVEKRINALKTKKFMKNDECPCLHEFKVHNDSEMICLVCSHIQKYTN